MRDDDVEYVGFWARVAASLIDSVCVAAVALPILVALYGKAIFSLAGRDVVSMPVNVLLNWLFPAIAVLAFWAVKQATPGKMMISAKIVDEETGDPPTRGQLIVRYLGYFVSTVLFGLGFLWVAFDSKKQGWHDKLARTVVIRNKNL